MSSLDIMKKIVQIKSLSGEENNLADFIMDFAKKNKISFEEESGNIILKFIKNNSKALIFNAHMDTVKPGDLSLWKYPPFGKKAGVVKSGKLYGLGASDAKASIAAFLELAKEIVKEQLKSDVFIVFVTKEEVDGSGSENFVKYFKNKYSKKYKEVSAILGEPTKLSSIEIGHRGNIFLKITTFGDGGHSSCPGKIKKHAVKEMMEVITKIEKIAGDIQKKYKDPVLGATSFCLTGITGANDSYNKVSPVCSSFWDIRTIPIIHNSIVSFLKKKLPEIKIEYIGSPTTFGLTSPNSKIVGIFKEIVPDLIVSSSPASNDICFFTNSQIPAVTFGPGNKESEHKENEYVAITNIDKSVAIYQKIINKF
ncbi:MAG: Acetylornithine deacetylase [Candidatus Gottesmanbacteria bacterium GW2011_GWC2_39_8]|uniref:Acetylornithine deacetylase n=1 Tax=Candidatus Gottesmanbacteria bacterium GW2011_GWC2_39_8 TaxID=1618450 RepID=A0A0G0PWK7_9BACT|nr:MAG: Acetylornithine deacetylase [Candidatus Gottesmanbacteria bacterium GW2011_GWC2_39_8]